LQIGDAVDVIRANRISGFYFVGVWFIDGGFTPTLYLAVWSQKRLANIELTRLM
jgi:hypothetical protein